MRRQDFDPNTVVADGRRAAKKQLFDVEAPRPWRGSVPGELLNTATTVLAYGNDTPGEGPRLHIHPYDETFILIEGRARFFVGDQIIEAEAGDVVLGPKGVPHRFINLGPGRLQTVDIHHSPVWLQTDVGEGVA
jgi:mannose-6-phosphate isomerase-like protein (cupin superfamily)